MGQKTIPQSLRLNHSKNWQSDWVLDKKNYSKLFYLEYTLRQYLQKFCKRNTLYINKIKLAKKDDSLNVYLHFYDLKNEETLLLKSFQPGLEGHLNTYLKTLSLPFSANVFVINSTLRNFNIGYLFYQKFKNFPLMALHFYSFVNLSYMAFYTQQAPLINSYLVNSLQKNPKHRQYLRNINQILYKQFRIFGNCLGYKLQFKGRVNGLQRSKAIVFQAGKAPLNTLNCHISYDFQEVLTPYGTCSLKTWLFYKK